MPRRSRRAAALELPKPLPVIEGVTDLGIRVAYQPAPAGHTTALLRLPNDYTVVVVHSARRRWAVVSRHFVVRPGVVDPRPLTVDPFSGAAAPRGIVWDWTDGHGIGSVLRALAPLDPAPFASIGRADLD